MSPNTRKNKTNQLLTLPTTSYFSIQDVVDLNPHMLTSAAKGNDITIRVRLMKSIEDGKVVEIGSVPGGKGRPKKVFSMTPVSKTTLNRAMAENVTLVDNADKLVNVMSVKSSPTVSPVSSLISPSKAVL